MPRPYRILRNGPNTRSDHTCRGEAGLALWTSQRWRGWNAISTPRGIVTDITSWAWAGHAPPLQGPAQRSKHPIRYHGTISTPRGIVTDITSWAWAGHAPPLHVLMPMAWAGHL